MFDKLFAVAIGGVLLFSVGVTNVAGQSDSSWRPEPSPALQQAVDAAVRATLAEFASEKLQPDQLAATVIDLRDPQHPAEGSYRGDIQTYPASVIKLFYLVAAHRWLEDKKISDTPELRRALHDMIVWSYNEATGYVVDLLTDTTSGPELPPKEIKEWWDKRNAVNRYFASLGYTNINVNKKPWGEGPYGRETQASELFTPKRNWLTTDATARLMAEIATGHAVTPARCRQMLALLHRDPSGPAKDPDDQGRAFVAAGLPDGTKLWSKAGWTSETRHDCAYVELPDGHRLVITIFTVGHASETKIIPEFARALIAALPRR